MLIETAGHGFVTGGAHGIGRAIAAALSLRGLRVTIADVDEAAMADATAQNPLIRAQRLDTRDRKGWVRAKAEAEAAFGPVGILINNAGIGPNRSAFADMHPESWDRLIAINLTGVFNGVSTFAAGMRERGAGHIVNTASMAGLSFGRAGLGAYEAAKAGVVALSQTLRAELASHGVGVSVLCPGYVCTNLGVTTARLGYEDREEAAMAASEMSSDEVAAVVLAGIEENRALIISHPDRWESVSPWHDQVRESFGV